MANRHLDFLFPYPKVRILDPGEGDRREGGRRGVGSGEGTTSVLKLEPKGYGSRPALSAPVQLACLKASVCHRPCQNLSSALVNRAKGDVVRPQKANTTFRFGLLTLFCPKPFGTFALRTACSRGVCAFLVA